MRNVLLCLLLAGCAQTYSHPTKSEADLQRDSYECERDTAAVQNMFRANDMYRRCMAVKGWRDDTPWYAR